MIEKNRILLKVSGESLLGNTQFGLDIKTITYIANEIKEVYDGYNKERKVFYPDINLPMSELNPGKIKHKNWRD